MQNFRELKVWGKGHLLALAVYKATTYFPPEELYGLTSQMRRSSTSIPANIAEGCGRGSGRELKQFLYVALGSASELDYHLLLARDLHLLKDVDYQQLAGAVTEVKRMLTGLIGRLKPTRQTSEAESGALKTDN